jgi:hypothetical protein
MQGPQEIITLFRAVSAAELISIRSTGVFLNPIGIETKYFSTSLEGAQFYAAQAISRFGEGPFTFVRTSIQSSLITDQMSVLVDRGISTIALPEALLAKLSFPIILLL